MSKSTLLVEMIALLRERPGITIDELAQAARRSERTVYRWLSEISSCLRTVVSCEGGGYFLAEGPAVRQVDLDPQELMALRLSLSSGPFTDGSPVRKHAESAWRKITEGASWEKTEAAQDMAQVRAVGVGAPATDLPRGLTETLDRAVDSRHRLRVVYRSQKSRRVGEYTLDPYALVFRRHSWYVVGYCPEHERVVQLKLARFVRAEDTGETFGPPKDFSVEDYFASSWESWGGGEPVRVRVRFAPEVAEMISEVKRHPSQVVYPEPDGGVVLEVTVAGIEEIATWIMGYGKHAVVLEPQQLRDHVLEHAQGMIARYDGASKARLREPSVPDLTRT
jgi:predicted DNA-binding transcriptional regulator YafY